MPPSEEPDSTGSNLRLFLWHRSTREGSGRIQRVFEHGTGVHAHILETEMTQGEITLAGAVAGLAVQDQRHQLVAQSELAEARLKPVCFAESETVFHVDGLPPRPPTRAGNVTAAFVL